jgi:hypothetical protein
MQTTPTAETKDFTFGITPGLHKGLASSIRVVRDAGGTAASSTDDIYAVLTVERDLPVDAPTFTVVVLAVNQGEKNCDAIVLHEGTSMGRANAEGLKTMLISRHASKLHTFEDCDWDTVGHSWICIIEDQTFECVDLQLLDDPTLRT